MRRFGIAAVLAAAALLLVGCSPAKDVGAADPQLRGQWELQSGKDAGGKLPVANQRITLTIDGDNSTTGRSSCADYTARVLGTASRLWVTATLPHNRICPTSAQQELEVRYIQDLRAANQATVTAGTLTLTASGMWLSFDRALPLALELVTNHTWDVQAIGQDTVVGGDSYSSLYPKDAWIRLSDHGKLTGGDACRTFSGRWTQNAGEIVISDFGSARTARCDPAETEIDGDLIGMLTESFTWQSYKGWMSLDSPRGGVMARMLEDEPTAKTS